jgi:uncharacterized cupin superfamily protein
MCFPHRSAALRHFGEPVGPLPKQTDKGFYNSGNMITGTWECEPGTWSLTWISLSSATCSKATGSSPPRVVSLPKSKRGTAGSFPRGWKGTAEVIEKVRKVYMMILPE